MTTSSAPAVVSIPSSDRVADEHVRCSDVLGSNSKRATQHPGNHIFKALVVQRADEYKRADKGMDEWDKGTGKRTRGMIIDEIIHIITQENDGRFLKREDHQWVVMNPKTIRHKVGQVLLKNSRTSRATSTTAALPERVIVATGTTVFDKGPTELVDDQNHENLSFALQCFDGKGDMSTDVVEDDDDEAWDDRLMRSILSCFESDTSSGDT